jgi:hypothetical protein
MRADGDRAGPRPTAPTHRVRAAGRCLSIVEVRRPVGSVGRMYDKVVCVAVRGLDSIKVAERRREEGAFTAGVGGHGARF